ncbi:hypothetical protein [Candidatus Soleaferrea massiliensis]|uniref:hypothetical protein n=1 Tax=Candidatus Soleaferrea massiliensis TaxID=1470354 RepID=UPI001FA719F8|nr:hypothetical protein [Candidatus Soleaferrea massiliensis]
MDQPDLEDPEDLAGQPGLEGPVDQPDLEDPEDLAGQPGLEGLGSSNCSRNRRRTYNYD